MEDRKKGKRELRKVEYFLGSVVLHSWAWKNKSKGDR